MQRGEAICPGHKAHEWQNWLQDPRFPDSQINDHTNSFITHSNVMHSGWQNTLQHAATTN